MAFLGVLAGRSADEAVREAARLAEGEGERWPAAWLRLCCLNAEAVALPLLPPEEVVAG